MKEKKMVNLPKNIRILLMVYGLGILVFTFFRLVLFSINTHLLGETSSFDLILQAFFMGFRFDTVIACYILSFPFVLLSFDFFAKIQSKFIEKIVFWFVFVLFTLAFIVSGADIPYFEQFFTRFNVMAFAWMDNPIFVFKMIFQEPRLWLFIIPVVALIYGYYRLLKWIFKINRDKQVKGNLYIHIGLTVLFLGLIFLGMRGRIDEKSPIRVGTAYFSNDAFLNQLGLNPNFTLLKSYLESRKEQNKLIDFMAYPNAIDFAQEYLNFLPENEEFPMTRMEDSDENSKEMNVVLILMESMSAGKLKRHGNTKNLAPFLDSLSYEGYYFENAYSSGIHTYNGVFSTLFSFPALFQQHPMKSTPILQLPGIAGTFKKLGYSTTYFTTHDGQFDNTEGFLRANGFEDFIEKGSYPSEEVKTTLGVTDEFMFEFAIPILNQKYSEGKPFFTALLTASDHKPYYIPENFQARNKEIEYQITEFADYSLRRFIELAAQTDWFENTLFVFVADHGAGLDYTYDVSINYNHIPILFYSPKLIPEPKTFSQMIGQIDVFPSVMGLLGFPFENQTVGMNAFAHERPYIYFNVDDKYAVIDQDWLLIVHEERIGLYEYQTGNRENKAKDNPAIVFEMATYAEAQMQVTQGIFKDLIPIKR